MMAAKKIAAAVTSTGLPADYPLFLESLKSRVQQSQTKAMLSVNQELIQLYWDIGRQIAQRQNLEGWGRSTVERLAADLQNAFPGIQGFSRTNIFRMRAFFLAYSNVAIVPQAVGQLNNEAIVAQPVGQFEATPPKEIESGLYARQGKAVTNFSATLPKPQSELAQQSLKDPYLFDFLTLHDDAIERDLEQGLVDHVQKFLLELGAGFAFVGRQVHLTVGEDDFYIDLLFYHLKLRCFVVIDLKMKKFTPSDAGQLNFYLSAVDSLMKHPTDQPTIGLILCKKRDQMTAEYALRDINKPIGVAEWQTKLVQSLPDSLTGSLPSIEQIEAEFAAGQSTAT